MLKTGSEIMICGLVRIKGGYTRHSQLHVTRHVYEGIGGIQPILRDSVSESTIEEAKYE